LGAFAYLEKPFDTGVMMGYVERAVTRRREILDKLRLEQLALEANRSETLGRVVSGMIHDLGTPLSVINTSIELDLLQPAFEPHTDHLNMLLSQVTHCREIVRSTLGFLRRQAREWDLLSINDLVETSLQLARPMMRDHNVQLTTALATGLPYIRLESILTRQALLNLINNACQAMDAKEGPRQLTVSTEIQEGYVTVTVEDTGTGVDPEFHDQIFESFYSTKGPNGTGLGLAVVKNVMNEHHGSVEMTSTPGQGAAFTLRFPIEESSSE
jgi:signal transduction histidine kinase